MATAKDQIPIHAPELLTHRRRASGIIGEEQLMECFGVSSADLECLRSGRVVEITLGERGELTRVRASTAPAAGSGSG